MKQNLFFVSISSILVILFCTSCNDVNNPSKKLDLKSLAMSGSNSMDEDTNTISALLYHNAGLFYSSPYAPSEMSDLTAYFTDGTQFVNPTSVFADQNALSIIDNLTGQYGGVVDLGGLSTDYFTWVITGYLGNNVNPIQKYATPIVFANFNWGDTISKSQGGTILYNGSQTNGQMFVNIQNDPGSNEIYLNDTTEYSTDGITKFIPDIGTITISTQDLNILAPGRYYYLMIDHDYYETEPYQNTFIGKYSKYHITTSFFLSE